MIPSYNQPDLLAETLASVLAQDPGRDTMQIEVVDDASTTPGIEGVVDRVGGGRVALFVHPRNVGAPCNFTACVRRSIGEWVHVIHCDDLVLPGFYSTYRSTIDCCPGALMCAGQSVIVDAAGRELALTPRCELEGGTIRDAAYAIAATNPLRFPAVVVARRAFERLGGFRDDLFHAADWEMWVRVASTGPVAWADQPLACYRSHPASDTSRLVHSSTAYLDDCLRAVDIMSTHVEPSRQEQIRRAGRRVVGETARNVADDLAGQGSYRLALLHAARSVRIEPSLDSSRKALRVGASVIRHGRSQG